MKVAVFTSNQARHQSLIRTVAEHADTVYALMECNTLFPGKVDDFFKKTDVMQHYFTHVLEAEKHVFGVPHFLPKNVHVLPVKMRDASLLTREMVANVLDADFFLVFGASYIKGWFCEALVERNAVNIHMGVSPYYRGNSTNFWAMYDGRPDMVGATIHMLSTGLDSGDMLFHAFPKAQAVDPFVYGMLSVKAAHDAVAHMLKDGSLFSVKPQKQDRTVEMRYSRNSDFNDEVAKEYLGRLPSPTDLLKKLETRDEKLFLNPVFR